MARVDEEELDLQEIYGTQQRPKRIEIVHDYKTPIYWSGEASLLRYCRRQGWLAFGQPTATAGTALTSTATDATATVTAATATATAATPTSTDATAATATATAAADRTALTGTATAATATAT
ncbi:hypothetical protein PF004_g2964 [Phytophthora fragariae]|uniref:Uncharacterized protein n=1 Tax=Phytophthora fragariae TaxID=53985 RepID=A0A6G0PNE3_9STRA|nr:hypothetical protein PF004_g2964 [Phytophthora fragariae]